MNKKRGFTLIELLVVIAIIGILAAIVLAALSTARNKGSDAKVKEQLKSVQNGAAIYYNTNSNYGSDNAAGDTICDQAAGDSANLSNLMSANNWPAQVAPNCITNAGASTPATDYAVWFQLSDMSYWCVDSAGKSVSEPSGFTVPTDTSAVCP